MRDFALNPFDQRLCSLHKTRVFALLKSDIDRVSRSPTVRNHDGLSYLIHLMSRLDLWYLDRWRWSGWHAGVFDSSLQRASLVKEDWWGLIWEVDRSLRRANLGREFLKVQCRPEQWIWWRPSITAANAPSRDLGFLALSLLDPLALWLMYMLFTFVPRQPSRLALRSGLPDQSDHLPIIWYTVEQTRSAEWSIRIPFLFSWVSWADSQYGLVSWITTIACSFIRPQQSRPLPYELISQTTVNPYHALCTSRNWPTGLAKTFARMFLPSGVSMLFSASGVPLPSYASSIPWSPSTFSNTLGLVEWFSGTFFTLPHSTAFSGIPRNYSLPMWGSNV